MNDDPFGDRALARTAGRVRDVLQAGGIRPEFSQRLRAQLVAEAAERISGYAPAPVPAPVIPLRRPRRGRRPRHLALWTLTAGAAAAAAVVVAGTLPSVLRPATVPVRASSPLTGTLDADPSGVIRLSFDQALDHASTQAALRLSPATAVRTAWDGDTLTVTPVHGLAPNSAYRLTVDGRTARTATGAALASDLQLSFGTAPTSAAPDGSATQPAVLHRTTDSPATDDAEAVVTRSGALLVTGARTSSGAGLIRMPAGNESAQRVSAATAAICVSRSGSSITYLGRSATGAGIVFAGSDGTPQLTVPATVDDGSPLGWIGDDEVTFVSRGRLIAIDREGKQRVLWPQPVDARQDIVLAPGGRYAYLGSSSTGELIDLIGGTVHRMTNLVTDPAFTADGAGLVWIDRVGGAVRVHYGAADGGTATNAPLPVSAGDTVSDLAVSPDATRIVYSLTAGGTAQLRLAELPDGVTLAASSRGVGESPNFSPTGRYVTVLAGANGSRRIETVALSATTGSADQASRLAAAESVATAFATAQVAADRGAQAWFARSGLALPQLSSVTRADLLWAVPRADGTVTVRLRLTSDSQPSRPDPVQAEETLTLATSGSASQSSGAGAGQLPVVSAVQVDPFVPAPQAPQVLSVDAAPGGELGVTFDSDLDPATAASAVQLHRLDGTSIPATGRYDAATRTVLLHPSSGANGSVVQVSVSGVRDLQGEVAASSTLEGVL